MEKSKIIVSNPCNKEWSKMSETDNGRYCKACNKTVIDFTNWEAMDIKQYLSGTNKKVCGNFRSTQVIVKRPKVHQSLVNFYFKIQNNFKTSHFKSFLLLTILSFMFLVGCNNPSNKYGNNPTTGNEDEDGKACGNKEDDYNVLGKMPKKMLRGDVAVRDFPVDTLVKNKGLVDDTLVKIKK